MHRRVPHTHAMGGLIVFALAGLAGLAAAELAVRRLRLADYPLYVRDRAVGYSFRPSWRAWMNGRHRWQTNAMGLRLDHDRPPGPEAVVLLGDSVVESGVHVGQADTLAARLARALGRDVYPVACPAWSLENQLAFLREHPELYRAGTMVFVTSTWDLAALARWETETAQPTRRPTSHAWYKMMRATLLHRRKLFPSLFPPWPDEADRTWEESLRQFLERFEGRLLWLLYPLREEAERGRAPCRDLRQLIAGRAEIFEVGAMPDWSAACYADDVHPNERGRALLLAALQQAIAGSGPRP